MTASGELRWWDVTGSYADALVAAVTPEQALLYAHQHDEATRWDHGWCYAQPTECPGPPTAPGVYFTWAE